MVPYIRPHPSEWCKNRPAFLMLRNLSRIRQSLILLSHYKKEKAISPLCDKECTFGHSNSSKGRKCNPFETCFSLGSFSNWHLVS